MHGTSGLEGSVLRTARTYESVSLCVLFYIKHAKTPVQLEQVVHLGESNVMKVIHVESVLLIRVCHVQQAASNRMRDDLEVGVTGVGVV